MISIVFPVYNERGNLQPLMEGLNRVREKLQDSVDPVRNNTPQGSANALAHWISNGVELIAVDDGSRDGSLEELRGLSKQYSHLKVIVFTHNFGQTAALAAGIAAARGEIVVTIDSDLENDPADIPILLERIEEGYDVVSGWRQGRWKDQPFTRKFPSLAANWLISKIGGLRLHDYGCTLKAYRRELIASIPLYGEMHRFIPAYLNWRGARVAEVPVSYRPRTYGRSNYGISRMYRVVLDLLLIRFLIRYMNRPIHFFGGIGFLSVLAGFIAGGAAIWLKIFEETSFNRTPLPVLTVFFFMVGVQLVIMGVLAEMVMRTYYESQKKTPYEVKEKINF